MLWLMACVVATSALAIAPVASATARTPTIGQPRYEPKFETTACDGVVPVDPRVECGVLTVPVERDHPKRGDVMLPVAIIRSGAPDRLPGPDHLFRGRAGRAGSRSSGALSESRRLGVGAT